MLFAPSAHVVRSEFLVGRAQDGSSVKKPIVSQVKGHGCDVREEKWATVFRLGGFAVLRTVLQPQMWWFSDLSRIAFHLALALKGAF